MFMFSYNGSLSESSLACDFLNLNPQPPWWRVCASSKNDQGTNKALFLFRDSSQDAIRAGEAISTKDCTVRIKLLAPPLYVLTTQTINRKEGIEMLSQAIDAVKSSIESNKGKLVVREGARAVSERDEKLLKEQMARLDSQNRDVAGDSDEEDYEEGMGDIDVENATPALQI